MVIDFVLSVVVANRWLKYTTPVWAHLIGPSSCGKTTILDSFGGHPDFFFLDSLSENSFVSGYRDEHDGTDPSLLPQISGKIVVILDFSTILSKREHTQQQILSDLRRLYDSGEMVKHKGNLGSMSYTSRFGLITGVTPEIEKLSVQVAPLGERFLVYRLHTRDRAAFERKARTWMNREYEVRDELRSLVKSFLNGLPDVHPKDIHVGDDLWAVLSCVADITSAWRTPVPRDYTKGGDPYYVPEPELPGRIMGQLVKMAKAHAVACGRSEVTEEDMPLICHTGWNCLSSWRYVLLKVFVSGEILQSGYIQEMTGVSRATLAKRLEDLTLLGLVRRVSKGEYVLSPHYAECSSLLKQFI